MTNPYTLEPTPTSYSIEPTTNTSEDGLDLLTRQAEAMGAAHKLATVLCNTAMVPQTFRGKPDDGAAAILYGAELGLKPQQALQQVFVVHGQPAIYARTMVALLKAKGYRFQTVETSDEKVTVRGTSPAGEVEESTWTIERAKKAGYTSNKKYQTDPQAMLYAKASSEVSRKLAPDVLLGIKYTAEDLELEPVKMTATREDVRAKAETAPVPALTKKEPEPEVVDGDLINDVKETLEGFTTSEQVNDFAANLKQSGEVPDEVLDLCRTRWAELEGEK